MGWVEGVKMGTEWYNDRIAKERQDRIEAQNKQLFDAKMEEINRAKREREALAQAATSVTPNVSNPTLDTSANAVPDPEIAKNVPTQYSVNGVQQADMPSMQNTVRDMTARKQAEVLNRLGNPMAALNLSNAADESKLNGFKVANAEADHSNKLYNTGIDKEIAEAGDFWLGVAAIGTKAQVGPLKGSVVRPQSDGAGNIRLVSKMPDGTEQIGATYPNTEEGKARARMDLMKFDPYTKTKILADLNKAAREAKKDVADIEYKNAHSKYFTKMADVAGQKVDTSSERLSETDKIELTAINKQKDRINEAIIKAKAEGSFDATTPGASSLTTQLAALGLKERQITQKYGASTASPDPLGMRKPSTSEAQMRVKATGDMGGKPEAYNSEIASAQEVINDPKSTESDRRYAADYLATLRRNRLSAGSPAQQSGSSATKPGIANVTMQSTVSGNDFYAKQKAKAEADLEAKRKSAAEKQKKAEVEALSLEEEQKAIREKQAAIRKARLAQSSQKTLLSDVKFQ